MADWTHPVYEITHKGTRIDAAVASFAVSTQAIDTADSGRLVVADPEALLTPGMARGDRVKVRWGYQADSELVQIFDGLVRSVSPQGQQTVLELIDFQAVLQADSRRITRAWEHVSPAELAGDLLDGTGLSAAAAVPGVEIDRFLVHALTPREALQQLVTWLRAETGEPYRFHIREGALVLALPDHGQAAVLALESGVNLIDRRPGKLGMLQVETMVAPVMHSQVITVDDERFFVEEALYRWESGGRTVLQVVPCAAS